MVSSGFGSTHFLAVATLESCNKACADLKQTRKNSIHTVNISSRFIVILKKYRNTWFCSVVINGVTKQRYFDNEREAKLFESQNSGQIKPNDLPEHVCEYSYVLKRKGVNYYYRCVKASFKIDGKMKHCLRTFGNNGRFGNKRTREQAKEMVIKWLDAAMGET